MNRRAASAGLLAIALVLAAGPAPRAADAAADPADPTRVIDLRPSDRVPWSLRNVVAWLSAPLGGWSYWYAEPEVRVDVVPASASVDLFYIRSNFQKLFVQTRGPLRVRLPKRIDATGRDSLSVRVMAPGFASQQVSYRVHDLPGEVVVRLEPLPNALLSFDAVHLAGRTTFTLRTSGEPRFRIGRPADDGRFTIALDRTADRLERRPTVDTPIVRGIEVVQVGEDLLIHVVGGRPDLEVRSRGRLDAVRDEHVFILDLQPEGARPPSQTEIRARASTALFEAESPCVGAVETVLLDGLGAEVVARAHRETGTIAAAYQREAMLRLGRIGGGRVRRRSGESLRTGSPLELALALHASGEVEGYLALLHAIARGEPEPAAFLHALVAPALRSDRFVEVYREADAAFDACAR